MEVENKMIEAVVFDLWNTLAYNKGRNPIVELKRELKIESLRPLEKGFMAKPFDDAEQAMINLLNYIGITPDKQTVKILSDIWNDPRIEVHLFDDALSVLKELKKGYKLGLISNVQSFDKIFSQEAAFFKLFDATCFSFETGLLKPDPRIFELMVERLGVKPDEALMVGDNLNDDVLAAKSTGMDAVLLKRESDYLKSWEEKGDYEKTIKTLYELKRYLKN